MRIFTTLILLPLMMLFTGCKDNTSGSEDESATNGLAVRAVNTGDVDLEISMDGNAKTDFCYESSGCEDTGGQSFHVIYPDNESLIDYSTPEGGKAVGIKISFSVDQGSGYFEVVTGEAYRDDAGFLEFESDAVVYTSDPFSEGDIVSDSYGEVD